MEGRHLRYSCIMKDRLFILRTQKKSRKTGKRRAPLVPLVSVMQKNWARCDGHLGGLSWVRTVGASCFAERVAGRSSMSVGKARNQKSEPPSTAEQTICSGRPAHQKIDTAASTGLPSGTSVLNEASRAVACQVYVTYLYMTLSTVGFTLKEQTSRRACCPKHVSRLPSLQPSLSDSPACLISRLMGLVSDIWASLRLRDGKNS